MTVDGFIAYPMRLTQTPSPDGGRRHDGGPSQSGDDALRPRRFGGVVELAPRHHRQSVDRIAGQTKLLLQAEYALRELAALVLRHLGGEPGAGPHPGWTVLSGVQQRDFVDPHASLHVAPMSRPL